MASRRREGKTGREGSQKGQIHRTRTSVSCALLGALAVAPSQSTAQTVPLETGLARPATPAFLGGGTAIAPLQSTAQTVPWGTGLARPAIPAFLGGGTAVAPATVPPPAFLLNGAIDLAQGYTTNANAGQSTSTGKPDTFTRGGIDLGLHYGAPRLTADAHYSLTGDYYSRVHSADDLVNRLNFAATSELVPDHLSLNVNAFAAPTTLSRVGQLSTTGGLVSNNDSQSYGYSATPTFQFKFGDYAVSQTSVSENAVFFSQPSTASTDPALPTTPAENTNSITATERIISEPYFGRFRWALTGSYADTRQTTQSQQQSLGSVDLAYALDRVLALLVTVGYSQFTSSTPLTQNPSGPTALAGIRYSYGPSFTLVAGAGTSNGFPTYLGSLNWNPTPTFKIVGSLTDSITTPQTNIMNNLSTLGASAEGVFSDAQSDYRQTQAQALFPQFATVSPIPTLGLALDNSIYHDRSAQIAFVHQDERNEYGLSFFGDMRNRLSVTNDTIPSESSLYGMRLDASRKLRPDLTGHAGVSYSYANEFGGNDRIFTADAGLSYAMAKNLNSYITGQYLRRQSMDQIVPDVPLSELSAIVGIRRSF